MLASTGALRFVKFSVPEKPLVLDQVTPERRRQDVSEITVGGMCQEKLHHKTSRQMQQVGNLVETVNAKTHRERTNKIQFFFLLVKRKK